MPVSVLSALARLDVDPWQKAAELAGLPGETAVRWMTSLIASLLEALPTQPDPGPIAARLIALLPRQAKNSLRSSATPVSGDPIRKGWVVAIYVALLLGVMAAQLAIGGAQSKKVTDETTAPSSSPAGNE